MVVQVFELTVVQIAGILAKALGQTTLRGCVPRDHSAGYPISTGPYTPWIQWYLGRWYVRLQLLQAKALEQTIKRDCFFERPLCALSNRQLEPYILWVSRQLDGLVRLLSPRGSCCELFVDYYICVFVWYKHFCRYPPGLLAPTSLLVKAQFLSYPIDNVPYTLWVQWQLQEVSLTALRFLCSTW